MRKPFVILIGLTAPCLSALAGSVEAVELKLDHPGSVALSQNGNKFAYTSFPDGLPLYIFEGDDRGKSKCDRLCTAVWPIVFALDSAQPTGDWIIIQRDDKRKQWAHKGLPVYTFYDDTRYDVPKGEDLSFGWWLNEGVAGPAIETYGKYKSKEAGRGPVWRKLEP